MKTLALSFFTMLFSTMLFEQDPAGHWRGALTVQGTSLTLILHVTKTAYQFSATLDSPDQNVQGIPVTSITFKDPDLRVEISNLGVVYEAKLNVNQFEGTWTQAGRSFPLTLVKSVDSSGKDK